MNPLFADLGVTIFEEMTTLARSNDAINLGQGFPDIEGPDDVKQVAADAFFSRSNQYPPMAGLPELREAVALHYRQHQAINIDPAHVLITSGATEAIAATLLALVSIGDEVLLIQPMYDAYRPLVLRAGGIPRYLTLRPPQWRLTAEHIDRAFATSPRFLVFNNPHNPTGRAFDREEIALLAAACQRHGTIAICDEVWEHILFDGRTHHPLFNEPGMADRTVKIGSAGKIFSMTGWKVGFILAAPTLLAPIARAHQFLTFTTPPALQVAIAFGLAKPLESFLETRSEYQRSRDFLAARLTSAGFALLPAESTYFLCIDLHGSGIQQVDRAFCLRAVVEAGVAAIPVSAFYAVEPEQSIVRLCFAKKDDVLQEASARLSLTLNWH